MDQKMLQKLKALAFNGLLAVFCTVIWSKLSSIESKLDQIPVYGYRIEQLEKEVAELKGKKPITINKEKPSSSSPVGISYEFILPDERKIASL